MQSETAQRIDDLITSVELDRRLAYPVTSVPRTTTYCPQEGENPTSEGSPLGGTRRSALRADAK